MRKIGTTTHQEDNRQSPATHSRRIEIARTISATRDLDNPLQRTTHSSSQAQDSARAQSTLRLEALLAPTIHSSSTDPAKSQSTTIKSPDVSPQDPWTPAAFSQPPLPINSLPPHAMVPPASAASPTHAVPNNHALLSRTVDQMDQLKDRSHTHQSSARTKLQAATHGSVPLLLVSAFQEISLTVRSISSARRSRWQIEHHISSATTSQAPILLTLSTTLWAACITMRAHTMLHFAAVIT